MGKVTVENLCKKIIGNCLTSRFQEVLVQGNFYEAGQSTHGGILLQDVSERLGLDLCREALDCFSRGRSRSQVREVLEQVAAWMARVNTQNSDGVILTPAIVGFLAGKGDIRAHIAELDRLRRATRMGCFDAKNQLQRELEYRRFWSEAQRQPDWPKEETGQRRQFESLQRLSTCGGADKCLLSPQDMLEARRTAWEAKGLLDFLREFRSSTERAITVVGNERYGRDFVVEPLEPYLAREFDVHYTRVPSHKSMRLTVPHYLERFQRNGFAPGFIRNLSDQMPHVVLVDVCSPRGTESYTKFSRGLRDLVNWFMLFNDIRSGADQAQYVLSSGFPPEQIAELAKWWEFEVARRRIFPWVKPGPVYGIFHWAPDLGKKVLMGDLVVPSRPAEGGNGPQVVVANPCVYRNSGDDLPELLRTTHPYFFNDPEKRVREEIVAGFGDHGFETRVRGVTTDEYVKVVQRQIGIELADMIPSSGDV